MACAFRNRAFFIDEAAIRGTKDPPGRIHLHRRVPGPRRARGLVWPGRLGSVEQAASTACDESPACWVVRAPRVKRLSQVSWAGRQNPVETVVAKDCDRKALPDAIGRARCIRASIWTDPENASAHGPRREKGKDLRRIGRSRLIFIAGGRRPGKKRTRFGDDAEAPVGQLLQVPRAVRGPFAIIDGWRGHPTVCIRTDSERRYPIVEADPGGQAPRVVAGLLTPAGSSRTGAAWLCVKQSAI